MNLQLVIFVIITLDLVILTIIRTGVAFYEHLILWRGRHKKMRDFLDWAGNYDEWKEAAENLDAFLGLDSWKSSPDGASSLYNERLVKKTTARLRTSTLPLQLHHHHPLRLLLRTLADACRRNHGGVANETLYSHTYVGTKPAVGAFHGEVLASISTVAQLPSSLLAANEKRAFFRSLSQNYGRTALCLSGGASLAYYHIGVLKALFDQNLLPEVITGSSAGALMAAIVCCRTDEEIRSEGLLSTDVTDRFCIMADPWSIRLKRWWQKGYMFDPLDGFEKSGYFTMGHLTFLEAYKRTRRILCIAVTPDEPGRTMPAKVLNFLTAPDIVISSVICATCAIPGVLPAGQLLSKDPTTGVLHPARGSGKLWRDGSIRMDIPDLSMLNIGFSIVSQVNPHIVPFFFEPEGSAGNPTAGYRGGRGWRGGFWAAFGVHAIDYDLKKWMALMRDLRLVPPIAGADVSQVFLQMFEGDVTILPCRLPRLLWDCARLLEDPERSWLGQCISKGQTATFAKVAAVRDRLGIEVAIREAREQLEKRPAHNEDGWNSAEGARVEWMRRGSVTDEWKGRREWDRLT
ncbi:acyl transferase/acyl hydrolase/lysophospholipase [Zopfochytrium polystomum]|nr:acyl transferase/acyl hydrolase/lysophospholipase [Zopfochytrium polystomum]